MRPGTYFIGDLSWVLDGYHKQDVIYATDNFNTTGEFTLPDGSWIASYTFPKALMAADTQGHPYPVKDGIFGCVAVMDLPPEIVNGGIERFGKVMNIRQAFDTGVSDTMVRVANVEINIKCA